MKTRAMFCAPALFLVLLVHMSRTYGDEPRLVGAEPRLVGARIKSSLLERIEAFGPSDKIVCNFELGPVALSERSESIKSIAVVVDVVVRDAKAGDVTHVGRAKYPREYLSEVKHQFEKCEGTFGLGKLAPGKYELFILVFGEIDGKTMPLDCRSNTLSVK